MNCGIYSILNLENGKIYVGQSIDIIRRFKAHLNSLRKNKHYNIYLQRAFNKYGEKSFEFNVLEYCTKEQLNNNEKWWINYFKSTLKEKGYNNESGGNSNYNISEETRKKMSNAQKGEKHPMYGKKGKLSPNYGKKLSLETRKKISKNHAHLTGKDHANYGKKYSEKWKKNMRLKVSKSKNTTGYFRVSKPIDKSCKQGFLWVYSYYNENNKRCVIRRVNIVDLKEEVLKRGLDWIEY